MIETFFGNDTLSSSMAMLAASPSSSWSIARIRSATAW